MRRLFFERQISKLSEIYGEKYYSGARLQNFWDRYQKISAEEFEQAINNLINNSRFAPLGNELDAELHGPLERVKKNRVDELVSKFPCITCRSTGRVSQEVKSGQAAHSFRCHCQLGQMLFPNFPVYSSVNLKASKSAEQEKPSKPHEVNNMNFQEMGF